MQLDIRHDPEAHRFYVTPEQLAATTGPAAQERMANMGTVLSYKRVSPGVVDFRSTLVPPHLRGRGLGTELVRRGFEWARREGCQVIPSCPFVRHVVDQHPEYADLVAERYPH